jgi:hypothetical protein
MQLAGGVEVTGAKVESFLLLLLLFDFGFRFT